MCTIITIVLMSTPFEVFSAIVLCIFILVVNMGAIMDIGNKGGRDKPVYKKQLSHPFPI